MAFKSLGLAEPVLRGIQAAGYTDPTPIQLRAIPVVLSGRDLIASAQTGTGKTAAFALPILTRLLALPGAANVSARGLDRRGPRSPKVLVLEPTRELAAQVETAFRDFARFTSLRTLAVFGGVGYGRQRAEIARGIDIIAATPGRLMDYLQDRTLGLGEVSILVLDEVDRMLDMGFLPVVKDVVSRCPRQRQTLFFSATVPPEIQSVASFALHDPERVEVGANRSVTKSVNHALYPVSLDQKFDLLLAMLAADGFDSVLVFTRTKHGADKIARKLKAANHAVAVLHSNRSQNQRLEALEGFKAGRYEVMVATDIAARGIDVAGVTHVINYDVPENPEDYVHRIGRTGRAQAVGDAFTLATPEDTGKVRAIQRFIGEHIAELRLAGFAYRGSASRLAGPQPSAAHLSRPGHPSAKNHGHPGHNRRPWRNSGRRR